jgi:hypothetical protein
LKRRLVLNSNAPDALGRKKETAGIQRERARGTRRNEKLSRALPSSRALLPRALPSAPTRAAFCSRKQDSLPVDEQDPPSSLPVDKQGWQLPNQGRWRAIECGRQRAQESRGKRTLEQRAAREQNCRRQRAGAEGGSARKQKAARGKRTAHGSRRQRAREERTGGRQRARQLFVSTRPARAHAGFPPSPFFFPTRPERLNRAQGDTSTHQATP